MGSTPDSSFDGPAQKLAMASEFLDDPELTDAARQRMLAQFREAVLMLPAGGVQMAWDTDVLTVEQVHYAEQIRHEMGRLP